MNIIDNFRNYLHRFISVSDTDFNGAIKRFQYLKLKKNSYFLQSGEISKQVAYLNSGLMRSYYLNQKGENVTYSFHLPDSHVTSKSSFVTQTPSALAIRAIEKSELLVINFSDLQELYKNNPIWQEAGRLVTESSYIEFEKIQTATTFENATEKYLFLLKHNPQLIHKVPSAYIASYMGVSRETLSRIKHKVLKESLI